MYGFQKILVAFRRKTRLTHYFSFDLIADKGSRLQQTARHFGNSEKK